MSALERYIGTLVTAAAAILARASRVASSADAQEFTNFTRVRDLTALGVVQGIEVVSVTTVGNATSITGETAGSNGVKRTYTFDSTALPYRLPVQMRTIDSVVNVSRVRVYLADVV